MKPILFNTQMVKAILDGKKTVTRRCVKIPSYVKKQENGLYTLYADGTCYENQHIEDIQEYLQQPYKVGDVLYVRETTYEDENCILYKADNPNLIGYRDIYGKDRQVKWKPAIHMPKKAARIFLKVTDVRMERLQDMQSVDAFKEGVRKSDGLYGDMMGFYKLWNSTIKKADIDTYGWDANPWVWVIEFKQYNKPIK